MRLEGRRKGSAAASRTRSIWTRLAAERGTSLVLALVIVATLSITTASVAQLVGTNEHFFGRDKQETLAFDTAEAGVNYAISTLAQTIDATGSLGLGATYGSSTAPNAYPSGTGNGGWWATKIQKTPYGIWQIWGTGTSPTGQVIREVSVKVKAVTEPGSVQNASQAWHYGLFVGNPGASCFTPSGSGALTLSIYVKGCIDLSGNVSIEEPSDSTSPLNPKVSVYAETTLGFGSGSAHVGTSSRPVASVVAPGGCTGKKGVICSAPGSNVYAQAYTGPSQNIPKPAIYPQTMYDKGDWDNPYCTPAGSFTFDNNAARDTSLGTVELFPSSSYDCYVWDPTHTAYVGHLKWNSATHLLIGSGLIYIDGDLQMNQNVAAYYQTPALTSGGSLGLALYIDGTVQMNGTASLCGPPSTPSGGGCTTSPKWDASYGAIVVETVNAEGNANPLAVGWKANGNAYYDLAAYVVGQYWTNGSSGITGPVITDTASVSGSASQTDVSNPPPDTSGASYTDPGSTNWAVLPATWQQLKPS